MKTTLLFLTVFVLTSSCFAQPEKGKVGISVSVQNTQLDFLVPIFVNDHASLSPAFGITNISDQFTDISLGLIMRYYFSKNIVSPYVGARFGALMLTPQDGDLITDFIFGPFFGGEYFFTQYFSVGIELQLNIVKSAEDSMRFDNPNGTNINTATAFIATIYF